MKKLKKMLGVLIAFCLALSGAIVVYAEDTEVVVGLLKYSKVSSINIKVKGDLYVSDDTNFYNTNLKNSSFKIKTLSTYIIKSDKIDIPLINKDKNKFILKDGSFYYAYGCFDNETSAKDFMNKNNIKGEISKQNFLGLFQDDTLIMGFKSSLFLKSSDGFITIGNNTYRNHIEVVYKNNGLYTLNHLNVEEYLYSVVPSEMPASWHKEALKAQSVAARNYAIYNKGTHSFEGFDVCDTIHCQVYSGIDKEQDSTTQAVNETKGIMAYYDGKPINAVFSSSSGGYTDNSENVWGDKIPYLRAVDDKYEEGYRTWSRTFTFDELSRLAGIGNINEIIVQNSSLTGRVLAIKLIGDKGEKILEKESVRTFFSPTSEGSLLSKNFVVSTKAKSQLPVPTVASSKIDTNTEDTKTQANKDAKQVKKEDIYIVASKGKLNNPKEDNIYTIDNKNITQNTKEIYVIDKNNNIKSLGTLASKPTQSTQQQVVPKPQTPQDKPELAYNTSIKRNESSSVTFLGKGWGHGVGLSQYGAYSLAKKGYKYDEILKYYYTGIEVR